MARLFADLVLGALIGSAAIAFAAQVVGSDGPLTGWTVTKGGEEICSDPDVSIASKEIECD
jgi:hypothetical protein